MIYLNPLFSVGFYYSPTVVTWWCFRCYYWAIWCNRLLLLLFQIAIVVLLQWRHNGSDGVSNHQPQDCHQMETFFALLTLCEGNPPVTGGFPSQSPVTQNFVFFDARLNKRWNIQSRRPWFETPWHTLWRQSVVARVPVWEAGENLLGVLVVSLVPLAPRLLVLVYQHLSSWYQCTLLCWCLLIWIFEHQNYVYIYISRQTLQPGSFMLLQLVLRRILVLSTMVLETILIATAQCTTGRG